MTVSQYQTVNLSDILCGSKGLSPVYSVSTTRSYQKSQKVESISGVDWYYYLVPNEQHFSLSDHIGRDAINRKFIVCLNVPRGEDKVTRMFAAFNSYLDFIHYVKKIPKDRWFFFEVILGEQAQKLYFDIDINVKDVKEDIDAFTNKLITNLVGRILDTYWQRNIQLKINENILIFSSHSDKKRSFHVIIDGYAVLNNRENEILASEVLDGFPDDYLKFIDISMYSAKQQLRLYQSQKPGSGRPKIFVDKWYYGHQLIEYAYPHLHVPDELTRESLKFTMLFKASCVTVIDNCQIIAVLNEEPINIYTDEHTGEPRLWSENGAFDDMDDTEITYEIIRAITERVDSKLFLIYKLDKTMGSLIILKRKKSAYCTLCERVHDSENAFLRINKRGKVYFYCRRNEEKNKCIADVSDLLPENKDLCQSHIQSIMAHTASNKEIPQKKTEQLLNPPSTVSLHSQLRSIGSRPNVVFKPRN